MTRSRPALYRLFAAAVLAAAVLGPAGCDSGPKVYPVTGKVVYRGKGPATDLAGYSVQFQSVSDPAEAPGGTIEADGTFTVYTYTGTGGAVVAGVKEGTYRACLLPPPAEGGPPPPLIIPRRYTQVESSGLEFTIRPGPNELTIEIDPK